MTISAVAYNKLYDAVHEWADAFVIGDKDVAEALRDMAEDYNGAFKIATCEHDWIDIRNSSVENGSWCQKCGKLRAENV